MKGLAILAAAGFAALLPAAGAAPPARVAVTEAWLRALPGGLPAGGYFALRNLTSQTLTLQSASSPACGMLMLHESQTASGMARMRDVAAIAVAPGATLRFAPGGYHLMCMDPKPAVRRGGTVAVTLRFADGTAAAAPFTVRGANGR